MCFETDLLHSHEALSGSAGCSLSGTGGPVSSLDLGCCLISISSPSRDVRGRFSWNLSGRISGQASCWKFCRSSKCSDICICWNGVVLFQVPCWHRRVNQQSQGKYSCQEPH